MSKGKMKTTVALIGTGLMLLVASQAMAAEPADAASDAPPAASLGETWPGAVVGCGAAIGVALVIMGGAFGISRLGASAVESMARQPEVAGPVNAAMIITAAMIEGATLFAVVVCLLVALKA